MISCKEIVNKTNDYLDRRLTLPERLKFRMHLFICLACNRYVKQLNTTIKTLARMQPPKCCSSKDEQKIAELLKNQDSKK